MRPLPRTAADRDERSPTAAARRATSTASCVGVAALAEPVDVVVKVDADVDFEPGLLRAPDRRASPRTRPLGIASGTCYEREDGEWVRRTKADTTVWGATRAYRSGVPRRT